MSELEMHYKDCWIGKVHHDCAVRKIRHMQGELEEARDELAHAKIRARKFETALADTRAARDILKRSRDFWRETCRAAEAERDQIRKEAQEQSDLVQRDWLSPCQKAGLEALVETLRRQLTDARRVARLWFRRAHEPMVEVEITGKEMVEALQDERATRKMLARQCDMARTAETEAMKAKRELAEAELAAHVHDKACGELAQTVRTERAGRRKAERRLEAVSGMARDRGSRLRIAKQRATRAEALAALVTEKAAALLGRLAEWAGRARGYAVGHRTADDDQIGTDALAAHALAAQIREALDG